MKAKKSVGTLDQQEAVLEAELARIRTLKNKVGDNADSSVLKHYFKRKRVKITPDDGNQTNLLKFYKKIKPESNQGGSLANNTIDSQQVRSEEATVSTKPPMSKKLKELLDIDPFLPPSDDQGRTKNEARNLDAKEEEKKNNYPEGSPELKEGEKKNSYPGITPLPTEFVTSSYFN